VWAGALAACAPSDRAAHIAVTATMPDNKTVCE
jgi:hypothetical protein